MRLKHITLIATAALAGFGMFSCQKKDKLSPGFEYMPDMYRSPAYKAGDVVPTSVFKNGTVYQLPPDGTIAHSFDKAKAINYMPYPYPNTPEGLDSASKHLKSPLAKNDDNLKEGERLYMLFCGVCHGKTGKGDGQVTTINAGLMPPAYDSDNLKGISEGQIFHATQYGKGMMGSYASQLTAYERWQVVQFVQTLQVSAPAAASDSTKSDMDTTATAGAQ